MDKELIFSFKIKKPVTSKKNSKQIIYNRALGRSMLISSKRHKEFEKDASYELIEQKVPQNEIDYPVDIEIKLWSVDNRAFDLSNRVESIMDLMVDFRALKDDNYRIIKKFAVSYEGVSKDISAEVSVYKFN